MSLRGAVRETQVGAAMGLGVLTGMGIQGCKEGSGLICRYKQQDICLGECQAFRG